MSFIDFDAPTNVARYPQRYESADELEPLSKRMRVEGDAERERETVDDIFKSIDDEDGENSAEKDDLATAKQSTFDDDDVDDQPKPKRVMAKIDPERLLGPHGLPALMHDSAQWKFKGKGHESQDLKKLLSLYQLWAHRLFPKIQFSDVVDKVEKICHQRRMEAALKGWKDAKARSKMEEEEGVEITDGLEREGGDDENVLNNQDNQDNQDNQGNQQQPPDDALFRSPSPPNDIPPDDEVDARQHHNMDDAARDALENEALAELERELGGF